MKLRHFLLLALIPICVVSAILLLSWNSSISTDEMVSTKLIKQSPSNVNQDILPANTSFPPQEKNNTNTKEIDGEESDPELNYDKISENLRDKSVENALEDLMKSISKNVDNSAKGPNNKTDKDLKGSEKVDGTGSSTNISKSGKDFPNARDKGRDKDDRGKRKNSDSESQQIQAQVKSLLDEAKQALDQGDYDKASELLQKSFELDPNSRDVLRSMANLYKKTGDYQSEVDVYKRWMSTNPHDPTPHYFLAETYRRQGNYDLAFRELQQFTQMNGEKPSTYAMASGIYRQMGMKEEEGQALTSWVNTDPNSPDARLALADYYRRNHDYNSAINQYQTAIQLAPGNVSSYVALGSLYNRMGMYSEAEAQYQQVLQLQPNNVTAQLLLAQTYQRQGDINNALQMYQYIAQTSKDPAQVRQAQQAINRLERQTAGTSSTKPK